MLGVILISDAQDRTVARLSDAPWLASIRSGAWDPDALVEALLAASRRNPDRLVARVAIEGACRRLRLGRGRVRVDRADARDSSQAIRMR